MKLFLGIDGGGSRTRFLLIDEAGRVLASHATGTAYYLEIGLEALEALLTRGIQTTLEHAGVAPAHLTYAFLGLPAYGEDRGLVPIMTQARWVPGASAARPAAARENQLRSPTRNPAIYAAVPRIP